MPRTVTVTATFSSGDPSITGVGFFINSGGNLGLQADNEILEESNYLREKLRSEIVKTAIIKIINIVGNSLVTIEPTQIKNKTSDLIELKATTLITIDATTVNITGL